MVVHFTVSDIPRVFSTDNIINLTVCVSETVDDKSGKSGAFLFPRRVLDFCDDRRSLKIYKNPIFTGISAIVLARHQSCHCSAPVPPSHK